MKIVWHPSAIDELEDILDHIAAHNQPAASATFELITGNISALANHPFMGRAGRVAGTHELVINGTSYVVAYEILDEIISIIAVLHGARSWRETFR